MIGKEKGVGMLNAHHHLLHLKVDGRKPGQMAMVYAESFPAHFVLPSFLGGTG